MFVEKKTCRSEAACGCPRQGGLPSSQDRSHAWTRVQRHERPRCRLVCNVCSGSSYSHQIQQKNEEEERGHSHGVLVQLLHQMPLEKKVGVVSPRTRTIPLRIRTTEDSEHGKWDCKYGGRQNGLDSTAKALARQGLRHVSTTQKVAEFVYQHLPQGMDRPDEKNLKWFIQNYRKCTECRSRAPLPVGDV